MTADRTSRCQRRRADVPRGKFLRSDVLLCRFFGVVFLVDARAVLVRPLLIRGVEIVELLPFFLCPALVWLLKSRVVLRIPLRCICRLVLVVPVSIGRDVLQIGAAIFTGKPHAVGLISGSLHFLIVSGPVVLVGKQLIPALAELHFTGS